MFKNYNNTTCVYRYMCIIFDSVILTEFVTVIIPVYLHDFFYIMYTHIRYYYLIYYYITHFFLFTFCVFCDSEYLRTDHSCLYMCLYYYKLCARYISEEKNICVKIFVAHCKERKNADKSI